MKHLFGVLLFLAIVIGSVAACSFLAVGPIKEVPPVDGASVVSDEFDGELTNISAYADRVSGSLIINYRIKESANAKRVIIRYSVYQISDSGKVDRMDTAFEDMANIEDKGNATIYHADPAISGVRKGTNLYLMIAAEDSRDATSEPVEFERRTAIPIVMDNGKTTAPLAPRPPVMIN